MAANYHISMYPWYAMGHMTPFLHLANELAAKGHRVSILLPQKAQLQIQHFSQHPNLITFFHITVPHIKGLPIGTETASEIPLSLNHLLAEAMDQTRDQIHGFLSNLKPDLIFFDFAHWVPDIAKKFGIKSICYSVVSASSLAIVLVPARNVPKNRTITEEELKNPPPGYPSSTVVLRGSEVRSLLFVSFPFGNGITFYERTTTAFNNCDAMSIRTCSEIEGDLCDYMGEQFGKPILLTGPVLQDNIDNTMLDERWAEWLVKFEIDSVVFCAFGSQHICEKDQFQELLLGIELTGLPFFIALKPPMGCKTVEEAFPDGFEKRVKGKGIVCGDWVQQPLLLKHPSIGCFVNHVGFGSMWESLMSDKQIVLVPHLGDQILNTRLLVEELKVGVEVRREENRWFSKESLCEAIKTVMDKDSEAGLELKKNHEKWREVLNKPGFMSGYIDKFVDSLHQIVIKQEAEDS